MTETTPIKKVAQKSAVKSETKREFECAGCGKKLTINDVAIVGPYALTWCYDKKCKRQSARISRLMMAESQRGLFGNSKVRREIERIRGILK